jgi:hypothetical protein
MPLIRVCVFPGECAEGAAAADGTAVSQDHGM